MHGGSVWAQVQKKWSEEKKKEWGGRTKSRMSLIQYEVGGRTYKSRAASGNQTGREKSKNMDQTGRSQEGLDTRIQRHSGKEYTAIKYTEKQDPGDDTELTMLNSRHTRAVQDFQSKTGV